MHSALPSNPTRRPATKNRFLAAVCHVPRYSGRFNGILSRDTGLSTAVLRSVLYGRCEPSYTTVKRVAEALALHSPVPLPIDELIVDARDDFPTRYVCSLFGCKCLPPWAWREDGSRSSRFEGVPPGYWEFSVCTEDPFNPNKPIYD